MKKKVYCRYEAKTLQEAKFVAWMWRRYALYESKIHIRRGRIVISTPKNLLEALRYVHCARLEKQVKNNIKKHHNENNSMDCKG